MMFTFIPFTFLNIWRQFNCPLRVDYHTDIHGSLYVSILMRCLPLIWLFPLNHVEPHPWFNAFSLPALAILSLSIPQRGVRLRDLGMAVSLDETGGLDGSRPLSRLVLWKGGKGCTTSLSALPWHPQTHGDSDSCPPPLWKCSPMMSCVTSLIPLSKAFCFKRRKPFFSNHLSHSCV